MIERVRYYAGLFNFGDDINPLLCTLITGRAVKEMHVLDETPEDHILMCGSILYYANEHSIVWGAGFIDSRSPIMGEPKGIWAVRGPLTAKRLEQLGIEVDVPYGDPVLLLKRLYKPVPLSQDYEYGVIAHYIDRKTVEDWPDNILRIDIASAPWKIVQDVNRCKKIISSSLHGIVIADTYNIPALWVKLSDGLAGDDFKFHDYFASIGRKDVDFVDLREGYSHGVLNAFVDYKVDIDLDRLYEACPLI